MDAPWSTDGKDAYIGWLKSEFAAANAIIDSMCQHVRAIGSSGDYDTVFNCLNRRRYTWTPTLYMQQFFSVAEIVNSLQEVAKKKDLAHCSSSLIANMTSNSQHAICQAGINEQVSSHTKSLKIITQCQQLLIDNSPENTHHVSETVAVSPGNGPLEAGAVINGPPHSSKDTGNGATCDNIRPCEVVDVNPSNNLEESEAMEQVCLLDSEGLDAIKLLNTEVAIASKEDESRRALIKKSVQFHCCELVDGQMINDGESGELCESVFSSKEVDELIEVISQLHAAGRQGALGCGTFSGCKKTGNQPDIIRFGQGYNDGVKLNDHLYILPRFLQAMIKRLTSCGILSAKRRPDSCLISIFNEEDFESPNTDHGTWERPLCVISLSGNCNVVFGHVITTDKQGNCKGPFQVTIPAGSVLLLQEKFAGILQKAVPASPSKRIIIALGKAMTSTAGLSYINAQGKARNKAQIGHYPGILKQARLAAAAGGISMHALPPPLPTIFAFPNSMSLVNPTTMLQGWSHAPASPGTGVFFPSTELNSVSTWQSGLLVSVAAGLEVRRPGHPKKAEKLVKARRNFDTALATKQKLGKLSSPSLCDGTGCVLTTST